MLPALCQMCGAQLAEGAGKPDPPIKNLQQVPSPPASRETAPEDVPTLSFPKRFNPRLPLQPLPPSVTFGTEPLPG